jgi:hypothetical protein
MATKRISDVMGDPEPPRYDADLQRIQSYANMDDYHARKTKGYQVLRWAKRCPECRTKNLYWVAKVGKCFACDVKDRQG